MSFKFMKNNLRYFVCCYQFQIMQNKINSFLSRKHHSNSTYYRSIRYKISNTTILKTQKASTIGQNTTFLKTMNESIPKKGSSYSTDKSTKFKRYATIQNDESHKKQKKMSYLQTWRTLLDKVQFKGSDCKIQNKCETIALPSIKQFEQSQFTILDPLSLPIQFIKDEVKKATSESSSLQLDIRKLKGQFQILQRKIETSLDQNNSFVMEKIGKMKQLLVIDNIQQQEIKIRNKRQCKQLRLEQKQFKHKFELTKQKISNLQQTIFQTKPFDLQIADQAQYPQQISYL